MAILKIRAVDENGISYWPEKYPLHELEHLREELGDVRFASQYLVSPQDLTGNILKYEWINYYLPQDYADDWQDGLEIVFGLDPSVTAKGDYMAIAVMGKDTKNRAYLLDIIRQKATLFTQVEILENTASIFKPRTVNIESNAAQTFLTQYASRETMLNIKPSTTKLGKDQRFISMAALFQSKKVLVKGKKDETEGVIPDDSMRAFVDEWMAFPKGGHDDTLDAVEKALEVLVYKPPPQMGNYDPPGKKRPRFTQGSRPRFRILR
jgi:predicted phage terminase large subunit-like protein